MIGFAAETDSVLENAKEKLLSKSLDAVIANCVANGDIFGQDNTQVTFIQNDMENPLPPGTKAEVAMEIMTLISEFLSKGFDVNLKFKRLDPAWGKTGQFQKSERSVLLEWICAHALVKL